MDKEDVVQLYAKDYYLDIKNDKVIPFETTWTDLGIIILSEVSQTEKDKYDIAYMWNLNKRYK